MDPLEALLQSVALPAAVAAVVALALALLVPRAGGGRSEAVALACGFVAALTWIVGWPPWPPVATDHWLPSIAALGCVAALVVCQPGCPAWLAGAVVVAALFTTVRWSVGAHVRQWSTGESWIWLPALTAAAAAHLAGLSRIADRARTLVLFATAGGTAVALAVSGSLALGKLAAAVVSAMAGVLVAARARPGVLVPAAMTLVPALLLPALWLNGWFYNELPVASVVALAIAPVAQAAATRLGCPAPLAWPPLRASWLALLCIAVGTGIAVALGLPTGQ